MKILSPIADQFKAPCPNQIHEKDQCRMYIPHHGFHHSIGTGNEIIGKDEDNAGCREVN